MKFLSHDLPLQVVGTKLNIGWVEAKTRRQASLRHDFQHQQDNRKIETKAIRQGDHKFDQQRNASVHRKGNSRAQNNQQDLEGDTLKV
jgi:hypothetical protein